MFQRRFAPLVESGEKRQTIRPFRKVPIRAGEELSLREWEGKPYRSKQRVLRTVLCREVGRVLIDETPDRFTFRLNGRLLTAEEWPQFARADGFDCATDMLDWFLTVHGFPFGGNLIRWEV